jgi:peptide chain release factor 3
LGNRKLVGTVGELQFEVIQYRLKHEYGASAEFVPRPFHKACWITTENSAQLQDFIRRKAKYIAYDKDDNVVFLAESAWLLQSAQDDFPDLVFHTTSEFKHDLAQM